MVARRLPIPRLPGAFQSVLAKDGIRWMESRVIGKLAVLSFGRRVTPLLRVWRRSLRGKERGRHDDTIIAW